MSFLLEHILRPYFIKKGYFFATEENTKNKYEIDSITFSMKDDNAGYDIVIKYGSRPYTETIKVPLDEILVFIFDPDVILP